MILLGTGSAVKIARPLAVERGSLSERGGVLSNAVRGSGRTGDTAASLSGYSASSDFSPLQCGWGTCVFFRRFFMFVRLSSYLWRGNVEELFQM